MEANQESREAQGYDPGRSGHADTYESPINSGPGREAQGRDSSRGVVQSGKQAARQAVQESKHAAREIGQEVKQQAREAVQELRGSADDYLSQGADALSGQIGTISRALRSAAEEIRRSQQGERFGSITDSLAGGLDSAAGYLRDHRPGDLVRSVENFARREPVLFLGGCLAVGVLAARFFKASKGSKNIDDRPRDSMGNLGPSGPMDETIPHGPLQRSGLGYGASPVDIAPTPPDMPPNFGGGV